MVGEVIEKKSKWGKVGKVILVISAFLFAALAVAYFLTGIPAAVSHFHENRARALALGLVIDPDAIQRMNPVPDDQNMDSIFAQLPPPELGYSDEVPAKIQKQWPAIQDTLPKLEDALKRPFLSPRFDFNLVYADESKSRSNAFKSGRELTIVATDAASRGDFDRTSRCLRIASQIAIRLDDVGSYDAIWDRLSLASQIEALLRTIIPNHASDPKWLELFEKTLKAFDEPYDFRKSVIIDHALAIQRCELARRRPSILTDGSVSIPDVLRSLRYIPKALEANEAKIDELYIHVFEKLPTDPWNLSASAAACHSVEWMYDKEDLSSLMLRFATTTTVEIAEPLMSETAKRYALLQAIALLEEKRSPAEGLPISDRHRFDLDGKPLRLKKLAKRWILYSVGSDGSDDGGVDDPRAKNRDFVVHLSPATVPPPIKPKTPVMGRAPSPAP